MLTVVKYKLLLNVLERNLRASIERIGLLATNSRRQLLMSLKNQLSEFPCVSCIYQKKLGQQSYLAVMVSRSQKRGVGNHPRDNSASGLTLIELLVVIFIIGILAAIALPTFFKLINKAKESEATQYIGYLNNHQKGYYLEATEFTNSFETLSFPQEQTATSATAILRSFGFSTRESKNYLYGIKVSTYKGYPIATQVAVSKNLGVRSYFGIVWAQDNNILVPCGPQAVDVSLASPVFRQVQVVTEFLANPEIYCPH